MDAAGEDEFREFVQGRSASLLAMAYALTGDRPQAEDLLQAALLHTYRRWPAIRTSGHPEAYVRRVMANQRISWWRRRRVVEVPERLPERAGPAGHSSIEERDELWRALARLGPRTRAVLVLRYWEDLPEREVAEILRCSVGSVKSQASRGLRRLRTELEADRAAAVHAEEAWS